MLSNALVLPKHGSFLFCQPPNSQLSSHIFVEHSGVAHVNDPDAKNRKRVLNQLVDTLFLDGKLRGVDNQYSISTYNDVVDLKLSIDTVGHTSDDLTRFYDELDALSLGPDKNIFTKNHINNLFENGVVEKLSQAERPIVFVILNDMTANGGEYADGFAKEVRKAWEANLSKSPLNRHEIPPAFVYLLNLEPLDKANVSTQVINQWKEIFFKSPDAPRGGYRTLTKHNSIDEIIRIVNEVSGVELFRPLIGTEVEIPVCPMSSVRYGVIRQEPYDSSNDDDIPAPRSNLATGKYIKYAELAPSGKPLNTAPNDNRQDIDIFYGFRSIGGIQEINCPPEYALETELLTVHINPPPRQNITIDWENEDSDVKNGGITYDNEKGFHVLKVEPLDDEAVTYELKISGVDDEDRLDNCPPITVFPRPKVEILEIEASNNEESVTATIKVTTNDHVRVAEPEVTLWLDNTDNKLDGRNTSSEVEDDATIYKYKFSQYSFEPGLWHLSVNWSSVFDGRLRVHDEDYDAVIADKNTGFSSIVTEPDLVDNCFGFEKQNRNFPIVLVVISIIGILGTAVFRPAYQLLGWCFVRESDSDTRGVENKDLALQNVRLALIVILCVVISSTALSIFVAPCNWEILLLGSLSISIAGLLAIWAFIRYVRKQTVDLAAFIIGILIENLVQFLIYLWVDSVPIVAEWIDPNQWSGDAFIAPIAVILLVFTLISIFVLREIGLYKRPASGTS